MKYVCTKMKQCKWIWLLLLAITSFQFAQAQSKNVTGTVTDEKGNPMPGVTVQVKGTSQGMQTDGSGAFGLQVNTAEATLIFSMMGYTQQEIATKVPAQLKVKLVETASDLNEVVVVGYGTQKKVNLTGALSVVKGEDMAKRMVASTSLALQGAAPGITVTQQSGAPGADAGTIRIRGISSMYGGNNPLVLIDNVEMSLDAIDANNIESITVLKDAAAASIYGSRAANGVILVTTKRGTLQPLSVEYNGYASWQNATNLPNKVSALEHMQMYDVALKNVGKPAAFEKAIEDYKTLGPDNFSRFNTDWKKLVLTNSGLMHNHNVSLRMGTDKIRVYASGALLNQEGLTANTDFRRTDFRFNTDINLAKNLTASMDLVMNKSERNWPGIATPGFLIRQMIGLPGYVAGKFDTGEYGEGWANRNPAALAEASGFSRNITNTQVLTGTLNYKPIPGMELLATYSSNSINLHSKNMQKQYDVYAGDVTTNTLKLMTRYPGDNLLNESRGETKQSIFRAQGSYEKKLSQHTVKVLGGFSAEEFLDDNMSATRRNFNNPDMPYLGVGDANTMSNNGIAQEWAMLSFYSRINYNYKDKYLFEVNGRWDASSRYAAGNRWGFFPSVSAGWRMSQESFWSGIAPIINDAKLRASYGKLGTQGLENFYPTVSAYNPKYDYFFNNTVNSGYAVTDASNPFLQWEEAKQFDAGLDLSFLNSRLSLSADYYQRRTGNTMQRLPIPILVGLNPPFVNVGAMENKGWELALGWRDRVGEVSYGAQFVLSDVRNKLLNLNGLDYMEGLTIKREGYPIDAYYGYIAEGLFQSQDEIDKAPTHYTNTKPGDIRYKDVSGPDGVPDGKIDAFDQVVMGNNIPRYEYSLNLNAGWKGFDLTAFFQGVGKRDNYLSGNGAWAFFSSEFQGTAYEQHKDYWTPDNPNASYPRLTVDIDNNQKNSTYWMRSGAYLRLKNVVLGYTLPESILKRAKIKSWRFYVSGQNLFTADNFYPGFDPEIRNSTGDFYPIMKTYTVGMNIKF